MGDPLVGKQFVCPTQKQGRDKHQRERVWASSLERRSTVSQQLGRDAHREERGRSECRAVRYGGDVDHFYRAVLPGLCLPLASYSVSFFTPD